jgi:hypothetical protein
LFVMSLPLAAGCGGGAAGEVYRPETFQGQVDTSLPQDLQAKQEALRRLLNGLQEGFGEAAALRIFLPDVDFRESFEQFFAGQKRLVRWDFHGVPQGNDVPVVLYFDDKDAGPASQETERREERVYSVAFSGRRATIARR